jgi:single-strand DNA-binding protein
LREPETWPRFATTFKKISQEVTMKSMNRVFLMGHLGRKPELMISKAGRPYTRLNVATNRSWLNAEENWEERTDWHSVFIWGPLAERCTNDLRKGALVFVEGSLTYWQVAQESDKVYKNAIHGHEVRYLNPMRSGQPEMQAMTAEQDGVQAPDLDIPEPSINHNAVAHPA